ncbi:MAG: hypothetical protein JST92_23580 [Deltaproteobacteria bacterium]|nr:hypothetical protein [Deltaproteobacteria bacterium]
MERGFFVLQTYALAAGEAVPLADELLEFGRKDLAHLDGFVSGSAFIEETRQTPEGAREGVIVLMHWRDRPAYERYRASGVGRESSGRLLSLRPKLAHYRGFADIGDLTTPAGHHILLNVPSGALLGPDLAQQFRDFVAERMGAAKGFLGARILVAEDESEVAELFAWRDGDAYRAYRATEAGREGAQWLLGYKPGVARVSLRGVVRAS